MIGQLGLPQVAQLGFVVPDMQAALPLYEPLFGPFRLVDFHNRACDYRGRTQDVELRVAYGMSGDTEVELIQPLGGDGPHHEFVRRGGNGMHHLQFRFASVEPWIAKAEQHGYQRILYKRSGEFAVVYMESPAMPLILEFVEPLARSSRDNLPARITG